jgi:hypothetical protein
VTDYSKDGVRKLLAKTNSEVPGLVVLIKPSNESRYNNLVDILDEMTISNVSRYALVDITPVDEQLIKESRL